MDVAHLRIDPDRLWSTLEASARVGPGRTGGLCRLSLSDEDREIRDLFSQWCSDAGLTMAVDQVGNMFARRTGSDADAAPVVIGSHLDTQVTGGKFDGILGVLSGLEIIRTLNDNGIATRRPIEVVNWTNEEGARFAPPMLGSAVFAGVYPVDWALARESDEGATFGGELRRIGYAGSAPVGGREFDAYYELHIEQAPILDRKGIPLGVVTGGYKTHGMFVEVRGETAHAGPTEMQDRRDAIVGAARIVAGVNDVGWSYADGGGKTTAPRLVAWPNKVGILSSSALVALDCRHPDPETSDRMLDEIEALIQEAGRKASVDVKIVQRWEYGNEAFDPALAELVRNAANMLDVPFLDMLSQAGHDAYNISRVAPTALIFTPCKDGITHNEAEHIEPDYTIPGVNALLHAVLARANR